MRNEPNLRLDKHRLRTPPSDGGVNHGAFRIERTLYSLNVISSGLCEGNEASQGWEHVSISRTDDRLPTWEDMKLVKEMFWRDDETVIQFHPKLSEYVNTHPNVLHLWKKDGADLELPPKVLI